ncbi:MAG: MmcQ/YjbR family DNA-binding protein [Clostridia bacterium]|nr:MmcQ/YjbR family DNA-binding protein [Clostridia bacterium]
MTFKDEVFDYIKNQYGADPEYLWMWFPDYAVFRHKSNRKWFAFTGSLSIKKLGVDEDRTVDILNLKMNDEMTVDFLKSQAGIFPGYHMSRGKWITVLLDGTVQIENIKTLIDESYRVTNIKIKAKNGGKKNGKSNTAKRKP